MQTRLLTAVAVVPAIAVGCSTVAADVIISVLPPTPQPMTAPSCTIEVCCKEIAGGLAWHCFTKCIKTNPDGTEEVTSCRGGPAGLFGGGNLCQPGVPGYPNKRPHCPGWTIFDGAWGPIDTYCGPFREGHPDWPGRGSAPQSCEGVSSGGNCAMCACIEDVMCRIQLCCVRYELLPELYGFSCNSVVYTAITECQPPGGGPIPLPTGAPPLEAPGWEIEIPLASCPTCPQ
jgi:hypothetical protein